ncbi:hypothetical protein F5Y17DRAFT_120852 [Xylariaceae sp. FL0594]|nr:hypothetical protein F5Y17DRAFT_120852 [Xylariaceae sp. FL0594]
MSESAVADQMASPDDAEPPHAAAAAAVTVVPSPVHVQRQPLDDDDESEWEYEYSTTETETFYVTLDLSKEDFKGPQDQAKGTFLHYQNHNELLDQQSKADGEQGQGFNKDAASSAGGSDAERDEDNHRRRVRFQEENPNKRSPKGRNEDEEDEEDDEDEEENGDKEGEGDADGDGDAKKARPERVQILDLHTENPIISYKGRVFSGQWCENATTELLMTRHDDDEEEPSPLPAIRRLANGKVDLLAASSARITVKELKVKPKLDRTQSRASAHLPATVIPPVDPKATQERIDQRNFLADLIALKRRKGETDDVTVIARSMQGKARVQNARGKGVRTHRRGRWVTTNQLQAVTEPAEGGVRPRRAGRKKGSGRGKWGLFSMEEMRGVSTAHASAPSVAGSTGAAEVEAGSGISTPTPFQWGEAEGELGRDSSPVEAGEGMDIDGEDEQEDEDGFDFDDNEDMDEDEGDEEEMDED